MSIKLSVAHLLGLASILTATTIAGSTPVKAAEMAVPQKPCIATPMSQATIASPNRSGVPVSKKVSKNTLVDVALANG